MTLLVSRSNDFKVDFDKRSLVLTALFFFTVSLIAIPTIRDGLQVFRIVSSGGDNISHLELLRSVNQKEGYFYDTPENTKNLMTKQLSGYPQGLHLNMYVVADSLKPLVNIFEKPKLFISYYFLYTTTIYIGLASLFVYIIKNRVMGDFLSALLTAVLFSGILFSLFALGFQTQIASYFILLALLIFLEKFYTGDLQNKKKLPVVALLSVLMACGISFTWLFLSPVSLILISYIFIKKMNLTRRIGWVHNYRLLIFCLILGSWAILQYVIQLVFKSPGKGINEIGYTILIPHAVTVSLVSISLLLGSYRGKRFNRVIINASLIITTLFAMMVLFYQYITIGEARYYYHKASFLVLMLSVLTLAILTGQIVKNLSINKTVFILLFTVICTSMTAYNVTNAKDYYSTFYSGGFSNELLETAVREAVSSPSEATKIIAVGSCNRAHDYTATRLIGVLSQKNDYPRQEILAKMLDPDIKNLTKAIKDYQMKSNTDLIIYSTDYTTTSLLKRELEGGKKENFIDLDFGHIKKNQYVCPNAVR